MDRAAYVRQFPVGQEPTYNEIEAAMAAKKRARRRKPDVTITRKDARRLIRTFDNMNRWIENHAELCEEHMVLMALDRTIKAGASVINDMETQLG